ncbi:MAG: B12-binding domain-containing radical SAM protein [Bacteroidota bacterium]
MKILLVYPKTPSTFWSFETALEFISKKSAEPPLGLITVAAMLPEHWDLKLIDMNVSTLLDKDIKWADYVFLSGMSVQINSFKEVIRRCNILGTKIVAGGPLATTQYKDFLGIDHFVLNEAEITLPEFLQDLENNSLKSIYSTSDFPDITSTPIPKWELLDIKKYASMSMQYSRGCPYDCEFCSITVLNGRRPRTKTVDQFLNELSRLIDLGWLGPVSVVDDNFIGNKVKLKKEFLPALINWMKERKYPFNFISEVSINLADDEELSDMLAEAGFNSLFVGIETPNNESLNECGKNLNLKSNMLESVHKLQQKGFIVSGGFIVGFDHDPPSIFDQQIDFIKESGIVSAMVGVLNAPTGTKLFNRMKSENRLLDSFTGNNMDGSINFIPQMNYSELMSGYTKILKTIYADREYYQRVKQFLLNYKIPEWSINSPSLSEIKTFFKMVWKLGFLDGSKVYFWKLLGYTLIKCPQKLVLAMTFAVYGFHFRNIVRTI